MLYAGVLLKADQDAQASEILRDLQGKPLNETAASVMQTCCSSIGSNRPMSCGKRTTWWRLSTCSRRPSSNGQRQPGGVVAGAHVCRQRQHAEGRELYEPLIKADPGNAKLQLGLADIALQGRDFDLAEQSVKKALELEPGVPQTLTAAARIYRGMGKTGEAGKLLRKAIEIEDSQRQEIYVAAAPQAPAQSANPFVGLPGQRREATVLASSNLVPPPINASVVAWVQAWASATARRYRQRSSAGTVSRSIRWAMSTLAKAPRARR
ncbi:tetratricopeptide repeat protein [Pseudomonas sp. PCH446]